jgi:hypothetical protein
MNMLTLLLENQPQRTCSDVADTSIKTAGLKGNPLFIIYWLAKEYEEHQIIQIHSNTAQSPSSRLWYLSNYHDALQAHMHPLHKLGNAKSVANYHGYNPQLDSALHVLSECQLTQLRYANTERHNLACSMIFEAISKTGSLGSCFVSVDTGSSGRLAMQNFHNYNYNTAEIRITLIYIGRPKWLFPPRFSDQNRFTTSRPDAVLVALISADTV